MEIAALIIAIAAILGLIALYRHIESLDDVKDDLIRELSKEVDKMRIRNFKEDHGEEVEAFIALMKYKGYTVCSYLGYFVIKINTGKIIEYGGRYGNKYSYPETIELTLPQLQQEHKKVLELKEKLCDNKCSKKGAKKK